MNTHAGYTVKMFIQCTVLVVTVYLYYSSYRSRTPLIIESQSSLTACVAVTGIKRTLFHCKWAIYNSISYISEITPDFLCPFSKFQSHSCWQSLVITV